MLMVDQESKTTRSPLILDQNEEGRSMYKLTSANDWLPSLIRFGVAPEPKAN